MILNFRQSNELSSNSKLKSVRIKPDVQVKVKAIFNCVDLRFLRIAKNMIKNFSEVIILGQSGSIKIV